MRLLLLSLPICFGLAACDNKCVFDTDCPLDSYCTPEKVCEKRRLTPPPPDADVETDRSVPDMAVDALPSSGFRRATITGYSDSPEGVAITVVEAQFEVFPDGNPCSTVEVGGGCVLSLCDNGLATDEEPDAEPPTVFRVSAGTLEAITPARTISAELVGGTYLATHPSQLWETATRDFSIRTSGEDAPAFTMMFDGTAHVQADAFPASIPQDTPLTLTWIPSDVPIRAQFEVTDTNPSQSLTCELSDPTSPIPTSALERLKPGMAKLTLLSMTQKEIEKSMWQIRATVGSRALFADGSLAEGMVQLTEMTAAP